MHIQWLEVGDLIWFVSIFLAFSLAFFVSPICASGFVAYLCLAYLLRTEFVFNLFYLALPEYTLNFWRPVIMVHPITACFLAVCLIVQRITDNNRIKFGSFMLNIAATVIVFVVGNSFPAAKGAISSRFHSKGY